MKNIASMNQSSDTVLPVATAVDGAGASLHDLIAEGRKRRALAGAAPSSPWQATTENCELHGKFAVNVRDEKGNVRYFAPGCPACRNQRNVEQLLKISAQPKRFLHCTFENFLCETSAQEVVRMYCMEYAKGFKGFCSLGASLLLCGSSGTGKNHLSFAISKQILLDGFSVLRIKAAQYLDAFWGKSFEDREHWLEELAGVDLLVIDEIGRSSNAKAAQDAFFRLIDMRYENMLPCLLTTNLNRDDLIGTLGAATYERLKENGSRRLTLAWDSYRSKEQNNA